MRTRFIYAALAAIAFIPFVPALTRGEIFTLRDHTDYFIPLRHYTAQTLLAGQLPFWNPMNASGEGWLANPQTGVFYPPSWVFLILPFATAYVFFLTLHVVILGAGAFLLFRRWAGEGAAFFGAVSLMLAGPTFSLLDIGTNLATFSWFPLVIWAALRGGDREGALPVAVRALLLAALFLGGEPFLALAGALLYAAIIAVRRPRAAIGQIAVSGGLAALLSMVQIVPFVQMMIGSDRVSGFSPELAFRESLLPADWSLLTVSPAFAQEKLILSSQSYLPVLYLGASTLFMALSAVISLGQSRHAARRTVLAWCGLLAVVAVLAAGSHLGPGAQVLAQLGMDVNRYPSRLVPLGVLAICALAAIGADSIARMPLRSRLAAGGLFLLALAAGWRWAEGLDPSQAPVAAALLLLQCVFLLSLIAFPRRVWVVIPLTGLVVADLLLATAPLMRRTPYPRQTPHIASVAERPLRVAGLPDLIPLPPDARYESLPGYTNLLYGMHNLSTPAPVVDRLYAQVHDEALYAPREGLLRFLSVGYLMAARPIRGSGIEPLFRAGPVHAHRLRNPWPTATLWDSAGLRSLNDQVRRSPVARSTGLQPGSDARIESLSGNELVVVVSSDVEKILVVNQRHAEGWNVTVDGRPSDELIVGDLFRAVRVPAGRHRIAWHYRPPFFIAGALISFITALFLGAMTIRLSNTTRGVVGWRNTRGR